MATDPQLPAPPDGAGPRRPASMTLRTGSADESQLDLANQSLAEALSLVFRVVQFAMIMLFVAFAFSGFSWVKENEKGIRLLFGRQTGRDLKPGPYFSAPLPLGELVRVDTGFVPLEIDDTFWPRIDEQQKKQSLEDMAKTAAHPLKPGEDGSLLTADANLAHTQWSVRYRRESASDYAQNILPGDNEQNEKAIVRAAVERGIVHAVAQVTIDELLKQPSSESGSVATRARELAQGTLDSITSGIQIDQLTLKVKAPPFMVFSSFAGVQTAVQNAGKAREEAQSIARNTLNAAAGAAYEPLVEQIDQYEQATARKDAAAQARVLAGINSILEGQETAIGEKKYPAHLVSGQVTNLLNDAHQYQSSVVSQRSGELASFKAKLAQFKANPNVVIQREWADAMTMFLDRPMVEIFNLPAGVQFAELWMNRDQDVLKKWGEAARLKAAADAMEQRKQDQASEFYRTRTGAKTVTDH